METLIVTTKEKQIIVEQVVVTGYVKHANGRKTPFSFDKKTLEPKIKPKILIWTKSKEKHTKREI